MRLPFLWGKGFFCLIFFDRTSLPDKEMPDKEMHDKEMPEIEIIVKT
jgi:hypothetical protein